MPSDVLRQTADRLYEGGVDLVASLPDTWIVGLIDVIKRDERFTHVGVSREESAIGICSGAFMGGRRAAALMGTSGFMASIYAISKINFSYQIGFPIVMNLRGRVGDNVTHHVGNGLLMDPILNALGIPFSLLDDVDDLDSIPDMIEYSRLIKRPYCICLSQDLWR